MKKLAMDSYFIYKVTDKTFSTAFIFQCTSPNYFLTNDQELTSMR